MYDLVIKNGTVIDPAHAGPTKADIAVRWGRIEVVAPNILEQHAARVIDAKDRLVVPGLIDLHSHVYDGGTSVGVDPDPLAAESGVTTWIDAGSAGGFNLRGLHQLADRKQVNIYAIMNISCIGLVAHDHELANLEYCSVDLAKVMARAESDFVVGVKCRSGRSGGAKDLEPLKRAKDAASQLGLPLMVHISRRPPALEEALAFLEGGDILTHTFTALDMKLLDDQNGLLDCVDDARSRGVVMDLGHGSGSFSWDSAEALVELGFWPDTISTDIHRMSVHGPFQRGLLRDNAAPASPFPIGSDAGAMVFMYAPESPRPFNLLDCMSKLMHLGMPVEEIVAATTAIPARVLGLDGKIGSLQPGACADIAILNVERGTFDLYDSRREARQASKRFTCDASIKEGRLLPRSLPTSDVPWGVPLG